MPAPVSTLVASDAVLASYLADLDRRITELERRNVGAGSTVTIGGCVIRVSGNQLVAQRISDGAIAVLASFA